MASAVWLCGLVQQRPNVFEPRVAQIVRAMTPAPSICWSTTSALSSRPRAFGALAGATSQQIAAVDADAVCWAQELVAGWRTLTWAAVPAAKRNRALTRLGVDPGIVLADSLPAALDKILAALDGGNLPSLAAIETQLGQPL